MKLVRVVGDQLKYPHKCACCLQPLSGTLEIRKEDLKLLALAAVAGAALVAATGGRATSPPYCSACIKHVKWTKLGGWAGVVLSVVVYGFLGLFGGGVVLGILAARDPSSATNPTLIVGACVGLGIAAALAKLRLKSAVPPGHTISSEEGFEITRVESKVLVVLFVVVCGFLGLFGGGVVLGILARDPSSATNPTLILGACGSLGIAAALAKLRLHGSNEDLEITRVDDAVVLRCYNDAFAAEVIQANPGSAYARSA